MREKIEILMSDTSLRVGEIAERLGVKPAVISHILKGRNQPNFVLTGKIISTFKEYNPYWWLGFSDVKFAADLNSAPSVENVMIKFLKIFQAPHPMLQLRVCLTCQKREAVKSPQNHLPKLKG